MSALTEPGLAEVPPVSIRTWIINVASRPAHCARTIHLHLPEHWPWQAAFDNLFTTVQTTPG